MTACLRLSPPLADHPDSPVSEITRLEVLGYHLPDAQAKAWFETTFSQLRLLPVDKPVIDKAIELRQQRNMSVGDAIIAATALLNKAEECEGFYRHSCLEACQSNSIAMACILKSKRILTIPGALTSPPNSSWALIEERCLRRGLLLGGGWIFEL